MSSILRGLVLRIELRKVGEGVAADAIIHLRGFLEMHTAQAPAEWATLFDFQIGPFPYAEIFGNGVAIISDNLESIGVFGHEPITTGALENGEYVRWLNGEPLAAHMGRAKMLVEMALKLEGVGRVDPTEKPEFERIAGLEVEPARFDVLCNPDLNRRASIFILANEIDRHAVL